MPESEARRFNFATNAWVRDDFLSRRTEELPVPAVPPREGRWVVPTESPKRVRPTAGAVVVAAVGLVAGWVGADRRGSSSPSQGWRSGS